MKFSFSFSLVKVLHRMLQTIYLVFSLSIPNPTFTKTCSQPSFEFGLFSSPPQKDPSTFIFPILFLFFFSNDF